MAAEITHYLAPAGRMADVNRILQVEMIGNRLQIVGIVIHIMAAGGLSRAAMPAAVECDDPVTFGEEEQHLRVPIIRRKRPTVTEHDGLSAAPVFVVDVDVSSVFFSDSYVWHDVFSFLRCYIVGCFYWKLRKLRQNHHWRAGLAHLSIRRPDRPGMTRPQRCLQLGLIVPTEEVF